MDTNRTIISIEAGDMLVARYTLLELLGRGSMGEVWKAQDGQTDGVYALKVLPHQFVGSQAADRRMKAEAAIGQSLAHDSIVRLYHYDRDPARANVSFLVMEYVKGKTLDEILDVEGPQPLARVVEWARQLAEGIDYAHEKGVMHRDIKPGNVIIESETGRARLLDFGIGRAIRNTMSRVSNTPDSSGTPAYMSPQQLMGDNHKRNDVYSLAATAYHALAGDPPFVDGHIQTQIQHKAPTPIDGLPSHANDALLAGLLKGIDDRPETARALALWMSGDEVPGGGEEPELRREETPEPKPRNDRDSNRAPQPARGTVWRHWPLVLVALSLVATGLYTVEMGGGWWPGGVIFAAVVAFSYIAPIRQLLSRPMGWLSVWSANLFGGAALMFLSLSTAFPIARDMFNYEGERLETFLLSANGGSVYACVLLVFITIMSLALSERKIRRDWMTCAVLVLGLTAAHFGVLLLFGITAEPISVFVAWGLWSATIWWFARGHTNTGLPRAVYGVVLRIATVCIVTWLVLFRMITEEANYGHPSEMIPGLVIGLIALGPFAALLIGVGGADARRSLLRSNTTIAWTVFGVFALACGLNDQQDNFRELLDETSQYLTDSPSDHGEDWGEGGWPAEGDRP